MSGRTRRSNELPNQTADQTAPGPAPGNTAPPSPRHFSLPSVVLLPTCATSLPIDRNPRRPKRAAGGPPLSGCLPAPRKDGESGKKTRLDVPEFPNDSQRLAHHRRHLVYTRLLAHG